MARRRVALTLLLVAVAAAIGRCAASDARASKEIVRFWGLGREGEVVRELVPEFERRHPGVRVVVQQIPWTAAHEKLLTAYVGGSSPDLAQLGNTWIPEFAAIGAIEPLDARVGGSRGIVPSAYFAGVWSGNEFAGATYGVPWYVDTRVLFYRPELLRDAGFAEPPKTWSEWRAAMERLRARGAGADYAMLLPTNEWEQLTILGLQRGSTLLKDGGTRGAFAAAPFAAAAEWYAALFRDRLAPVVSYTQLGNPYQEFDRGYFAMWMTGPWNLGEFRRRLPPERQASWMTCPLPAPDGTEWPGVSFAGGSSLAIFRGSRQKDGAWLLAEYLSEPEVQRKFYELSGDLPARRETWDSEPLAGDAHARAFRVQLSRVEPLPRVPEWEQIAQKLAEDLEAAIRGRQSVPAALAALDRDVDRILEKRRWILARAEARRGR